MTATTVADLLTADREADRTALVDERGRAFDHHWLCTSAWQAGNFLRHSGVRRGVTVGVAGEGPFALLAFFGATLLEARTRFDPPPDLADDVRALVAPVEDLESGEFVLPRGAQRVGYGDRPTDPAIHHFEAGIWTENPAFPPLDVDPDTDLLTDGDRTETHADAVDGARGVIEAYGLDAGDRVVVRDSLAHPGTVVAGVIAPLLVGGVIALGDVGESADAAAYVVSSGDPGAGVAEPARIDPADVRAPR